MSLLVTVWPGVVGRGPQVLQWELGALLGFGPSGCEVNILRSFPKGMAWTIWFSNRNFRFSYLNGIYPFTPDVPGSSAPFPLSFICFSVVLITDYHRACTRIACSRLQDSGEKSFRTILPESLAQASTRNNQFVFLVKCVTEDRRILTCTWDFPYITSMEFLALFSRASIYGETFGRVAKCRLFSRAVLNIILSFRWIKSRRNYKIPSRS